MTKLGYTIFKEVLSMEKVILGERLKELRTKFGFTQADISSLLGVDQSLISKYESGERQVSMRNLATYIAAT